MIVVLYYFITFEHKVTNNNIIISFRAVDYMWMHACMTLYGLCMESELHHYTFIRQGQAWAPIASSLPESQRVTK